MWFFIVTLMVVGSFFCGLILTAYVHKDELVTYKDYLKEIKVITDSLRRLKVNSSFVKNPSYLRSLITPGINAINSRISTIESRILKIEEDIGQIGSQIPNRYGNGVPMPDPSKHYSPCVVTCDDDK
jgi:hypothetical protein